MLNLINNDFKLIIMISIYQWRNYSNVFFPVSAHLFEGNSPVSSISSCYESVVLTEEFLVIVKMPSHMFVPYLGIHKFTKLVLLSSIDATHFVCIDLFPEPSHHLLTLFSLLSCWFSFHHGFHLGSLFIDFLWCCIFV